MRLIARRNRPLSMRTVKRPHVLRKVYIERAREEKKETPVVPEEPVKPVKKPRKKVEVPKEEVIVNESPAMEVPTVQVEETQDPVEEAPKKPRTRKKKVVEENNEINTESDEQ